MFDCNLEVSQFHNEVVTLPETERSEMRDRRNANRSRLIRGLKNAEKTQPFDFKSQGSYAMRTMLSHPQKDYDIDDGVYYFREDLVGPRGGDMSSLQVREMIRNALDDGSFNKPPEVRKNCVRVYYEAGYHVDMPIYRRVSEFDILGTEFVFHELASVEWRRSDARDVTSWFDRQNNEKSPDTTNGRQLRRIVRFLKKFAKSRQTWESTLLSGFGITILVVECYKSSETRDDLALVNTIRAIRDRLNWDKVVKHPVTPNHTITKGSDDSKARLFRDKLSNALEWLQPLQDPNCTRTQALACWDTVYNTSFFSQLGASSKVEAKAMGQSESGLYSMGLFNIQSRTPSSYEPVQKQGDGRYA